jgi:protein involved in polysaccharide export with SLBB domain
MRTAMKSFLQMGFAALALTLSACAGLSAGPDITVTTSPPAANCVLTRQGAVVAGISPTPGTVTVGATSADITIKCNKDGYKEATASGSSQNGGVVSIPLVAAGPYRLDSGDVVRVIIYNQMSLSTDYKVGDSGTISVPLLGEVKARSLTAQELQKAIYDAFNNGIFVNPGVSVEVSQYRPLFIVGEVTKPGQYPYTPGMNVFGAVAVAGGFTIRADSHRMSMIRKEQTDSTEVSADPLTEVQPGDVIVIHEHFF